MATDGDLNVGISSLDDLEKFITERKDEGVFLSILGFGEGNYKDDKLEKLADCGNGNYSYIDSLFEGKKVLVDEFSSTMFTVAKDVKLQVEFNPANVHAYKLIGYENRVMADKDFNDDSKDGGEIGAGHSIVALFEIVPTRTPDAIPLKYQDKEVEIKADSKIIRKEYDDEFATVSVRYKDPESYESKLFSIVVNDEVVTECPSQDFKFASMVAEFALILSDSNDKGTASLEDIMKEYKTLKNTDDYQDEFFYLVRTLARRA
jgi:Ca-activated chloride channel family protein